MPFTLTGGSGAPGKSVPTGNCVGSRHGEIGPALVCNRGVVACVTRTITDDAIADGLGYPTVDDCMEETHTSR